MCRDKRLQPQICSVIIEDLANAFKIANLEDCRFCGFNLVVIDHRDRCREAADTLGNRHRSIVKGDSCVVEQNVGCSIEVINASDLIRTASGSALGID